MLCMVSMKKQLSTEILILHPLDSENESEIGAVIKTLLLSKESRHLLWAIGILWELQV